MVLAVRSHLATGETAEGGCRAQARAVVLPPAAAGHVRMAEGAGAA